MWSDKQLRLLYERKKTINQSKVTKSIGFLDMYK